MGLINELTTIIEESRIEAKEVIDSKDESGINKIAPNLLFSGDNIKVMKLLLDQGFQNKLSLIYIDPPFFSNADYKAVIKVGEETTKTLAYKDKWGNDIGAYLKMLCIRLLIMKELLSDEGLIWVHLDWHVVHYAKILMDEIFGEKNFVNEIIWNYKSGGSNKHHFARKHDNILVYSKTKKYNFYPIKEKSYNRKLKPYRFKGVEEFQDDIGWYTLVNMKDVWNIDMVGRTSKERTGYATQKPEALLERIIESSTTVGDICADFFCGSGTMASVASKKGRKFIVCDQGEIAVSTTKQRLECQEVMFETCTLTEAD